MFVVSVCMMYCTCGVGVGRWFGICSVVTLCFILLWSGCVFFFQAEDGIRDLVRSRGLGDVYKRQFFARLIYSLGEVDESRTQEILGAVKFVCSLAGLKRSGI